VPALLELAHIHKRFGRVTVADDVSLSVDAGGAVGIVGPNGAGKTSLFGIISGDLRPDAGEIRFDGSVVNRLDAARRCRLGIGRTYQVPQPFERMTVFENVLVAAQQGGRARAQDSYDRAASALRRTELLAHANRSAGSLGLLDRKRLELARALGTGPRILLLDEVAGGLTEPEMRQLVEIVKAIRAEGTAIVWIEHVVRALVAAVDRLVCLAGGTFIGDGPPRQVLESAAVREVYLGTEELAIGGSA
jgi:branched-chain amino acid transport system ATP-binding protein